MRAALTMLVLFGAAASWVLGFASMFIVIGSRRPDVPASEVRRQVGLNPFNILFLPSALTESGRKWRKVWFWSISCFVASIGIGLIASEMGWTLLK